MAASRELNLKIASLSAGVFSAAAYVTCLVYGLLKANALHHQLFELLPWFKWVSPASFLIGLADMFFIGAFYGALFVLIYNHFARNYGRAKKR